MKVITIGIMPQEKVRARAIAIARGQYKPKPNDPKIFGFAWRGNTLYLYSANCSDDKSPGCIIDRKHPIAALHRAT